MIKINNCIICVEKMNKTKKKKVVCPYCSFESCRECCEKYILDQSYARCMNNTCKKEWTRKDMSEIFTMKFINKEWKEHMENILFEQEMALLPSTQPLVEKIIINEGFMEEKLKILKEIKILKNRKNELNLLLINNGLVIDKEFVRSCPVEDCRGFLNMQWKCGLCKNHICSDCHYVKGLVRNVEHTCDADELATALLIKKDTKPCPKCGTGIFKIDGCDQMWCTLCHTGFSWRTGKIETRIHNPHYYEWRRTNGNEIREPGDIQCGQILDQNFTINILNLLLDKEIKFGFSKKILSNDGEKLYDRFEILTIKLIHFGEIDLRHYRVDENVNNEELRIKYLRKIIDKKIFKQKIQMKYKSREKNKEIYDVLDLFYKAIIDIIFRSKDMIKSTNYILINNNLDEIYLLINYVNECLKNISKIYESKNLYIDINDQKMGLLYTE